MKKIIAIILLVLVNLFAFTQSNFTPKILLTPAGRPNPPQLVNDFTHTLTADQKYTLEQKLESFSKATTTQVAVVLIPSLGEYEILDFNYQLGRAWGIGGKANNNGVMLLVCTDPQNHKLNIATGYGVEGALPDITCKEIIDNVITPNFKGGDYYGGLNQGTDAIIAATKGEYTAKTTGDGISLGTILFLIILVVVLLSFFSGKGGSGGSFMSRRGSTGVGNSLFWLNMLSGGSGGGGGSNGGGGFGGFGGGSFGGGGASGSW